MNRVLKIVCLLLVLANTTLFAKEAKTKKKEPKNKQKTTAVKEEVVVEKKEKTVEVKKDDELLTLNSDKKYVLEDGIVSLEYIPSSGSIALAIVKEDGKKVPAIINKDITSFIALRVDNSYYNLNDLSRVEYGFEKNDKSMKITYTIKNLVSVEAFYTLSSSGNSKKTNILNIEYKVNNISKESHIFGIRAVYDTILGESRPSHFTTSLGPVLSESSFTNMEKTYWIISSNGMEAIEFLLHGKKVTPISKVILANKDVVSEREWRINEKVGRSFNSITSYNNSAVAFIWDDMDIPNGKSQSVSFVTAYSLTDFQMSGNPLNGIITDDEEKPVENTSKVLNEGVAPKNQQTPTVPTPNANVVAPVTTTTNIPSTQPKKDVIVDPSQIREEQLDPVYVQNLINKINALDPNDPNVDLNQIEQLKAELAAILKVIRSGQ